MTPLQEALLTALAAGRELEETLVDACDDRPRPGDDRWTAKDHLAHLAVWREEAAALLDAVRAGTAIPEGTQEEVERNAQIFLENRDRPASQVLARAGASYDRLRRAVEACSDEDLLKPRPAGGAARVWELVPGHGEGHTGQHLVYWHLERGDWAAAEQVARRVHEVETAAFDDPRRRAAATYNLGCFYAVTGRPQEALRLVQRAFELHPELAAWARQDPDLEPIRDLLQQTE